MENINKMHRSPDPVEGGGHNSEKENKNAEILKTFSFHDDNGQYIEALKKSFETMDLAGLENAAFVNIEIKTSTNNRQDFTGVDIAEDLIRQDSDKKILVYGFSDLDLIRKTKAKIDLLIAKGNVKFIRLPFTPEDAISVLKDNAREEVAGEKLQEIQDKEIEHKVGVLLHTISNVGSAEDISQADPQRLASMIADSKTYFPALNGKTDKQVVEFLFAVRQNVPEVMKGQNIEGVYCDIEGTLFNGKELNVKTLDMLKKFEAQGKNITLWTDGDVAELQTLLDAAGIVYPLKSKIDYAGASAEIVIDNDDSNTFSAKTRIYAKEFITV